MLSSQIFKIIMIMNFLINIIKLIIITLKFLKLIYLIKNLIFKNNKISFISQQKGKLN